MSRGSGHIQRSILAVLETDIDGAWTLSELCQRVCPGIDRIEKKHRVAVARAIRTMALPGTWCVRRIEASGGEYCLCNECSLLSMARRDWFAYLHQGRGQKDFAEYMASHSHRYGPGNPYNTFSRVESAKRYRDGSEIDRIDMEIDRIRQIVGVCKAVGIKAGAEAGAAAMFKNYAEEMASLQKRRDELKAIDAS